MVRIENCQTPVLGLGLGVDFTFTWDDNDNDSDKNNPHLKFMKGTVLEKEQGLGIRDKGKRSKGQWPKGPQRSRDKA